MIRPEMVVGETHKIKLTLPSGVGVTIYVTVNIIDNKPYEVFINARAADYWEHLTAVSVMISRLLQAGIPIGTIADDLKQIHSPNTGHLIVGGWSPSIYARIGDVLAKYAPLFADVK